MLTILSAHIQFPLTLSLIFNTISFSTIYRIFQSGLKMYFKTSSIGESGCLYFIVCHYNELACRNLMYLRQLL